MAIQALLFGFLLAFAADSVFILPRLVARYFGKLFRFVFGGSPNAGK